MAALKLRAILARPNIVFVLSDDLEYNDIGYHAIKHKSVMKSPFLNSLAMAGIRLELLRLKHSHALQKPANEWKVSNTHRLAEFHYSATTKTWAALG
ncbi:unnamed protein product [Clavelina lepadiformis]|uniref:Sulfatase N-terminal domain-containing protein n=1 Tax=Clavelina lepadiformis TaxID=159417 RepID=A0ABP0F2I6_CLALP